MKLLLISAYFYPNSCGNFEALKAGKSEHIFQHLLRVNFIEIRVDLMGCC